MQILKRSSWSGAIGLVVLLGFSAANTQAAERGFVTVTFGNQPLCEHKDTLAFRDKVLRFDLSALPAKVKVVRAVLRVSDKGHQTGATLRVVPVGLSAAGPLKLIPPDFNRFDLLKPVQTWVENATANKGLRVEAAGGVDFSSAVLEVSYHRSVDRSLPVVTGLRAVHRGGQTFLSFHEPHDIIGEDAPTFEAFEKTVLEAWSRRQVTYRVYAHTEAITPTNLAHAELVRELPEGLTCWDLLRIPRGGPGPGEGDHAYAQRVAKGEATQKYSPLASGPLLRSHVMTRFRIAKGAEPLPRATGLAVFTAQRPGKRYYAVTVALAGREAVTALKVGENVSPRVDEQPAKFPTPVWQRTVPAQRKQPQAPAVEVHAVWLDPPSILSPGPVELYTLRWPDQRGLPAKGGQPLWINLVGGFSGGPVDNPIFYLARRHLRPVFTVSLTGGRGLWAGDHECLGTLRGYDQGLVWNQGERLAMAATAWAVANPDFAIDRERVYLWGTWATFALRHGDIFAMVMSNGHGNYKSSNAFIKGQYPRWGPAGRGKNCFGVEHLDYLDMAKWVRGHPQEELPFWVCAEDQGFFPDHTLGDFGFKPWQEFLTAMKETRRAFAAEWNSNGTRETRGVVQDMGLRIKLHQSLPAFTNCSLDSSPDTDKPKGTARYKGNKDYLLRADKEGGINLHQRWDPENLVDRSDRWELTLWLAANAPRDQATTDLTPRRCQKLKSKPGSKFTWTNTLVSDGKIIQSGDIVADRWGLLTLPKVTVRKEKCRIAIVPAAMPK
jgi:hypothetical protein